MRGTSRPSKNRDVSRETRQEQRKAILAALDRVSGEEARSTDPPAAADNSTSDYYTLTSEEMAALASGNIEKIETWVSNLDQRHATRLLRWLIKKSP